MKNEKSNIYSNFTYQRTTLVEKENKDQNGNK